MGTSDESGVHGGVGGFRRPSVEEHGDVLTDEQIAAMKRWKREHQADFFPSWDLVNRRMLVSRDAVNARLNEISGASASALAASTR